MKGLYVLTSLPLYAILVLAAGWTLITALSGESKWSIALENLAAHRFMAGGASAAVLVLAVIALVTRFGKKGREHYLSFDSEGGAVSISVKAVSDFISRLGDEFAAVINMKPSISARDNALEIEVDMRVRAGSQIPELCQVLQARIRESVREHLGIMDVSNVDIRVKEIVGATPVESAATPGRESER